MPTAAPYGYCPQCRSPGVLRERRLFGDDECANGHKYPSGYAMYDPGADTGMCPPGQHRWRSKEMHTPDIREWVTYCDICGCEHPGNEGTD